MAKLGETRVYKTLNTRRRDVFDIFTDTVETQLYDTQEKQLKTKEGGLTKG